MGKFVEVPSTIVKTGAPVSASFLGAGMMPLFGVGVGVEAAAAKRLVKSYGEDLIYAYNWTYASKQARNLVWYR